jgi:hypothetical protein
MAPFVDKFKQIKSISGAIPFQISTRFGTFSRSLEAEFERIQHSLGVSHSECHYHQIDYF